MLCSVYLSIYRLNVEVQDGKSCAVYKQVTLRCHFHSYVYIKKKKIALGFWSGFMIMGCQTAGSTLRLFTHLIPLKTLYLAYLT